MSRSRNRRTLDQAVAALNQRFGYAAVQKGGELAKKIVPPGVPTGFATLDTLTGCGGVPLKCITLVSGKTTSGKLTVAYKVLANAQRAAKYRFAVGIISLNESSDPDYLARCGVDLDRLLIAYPRSGLQAIDLVADGIRTGKLRAILVDSLPDMTLDTTAARALTKALPAINALLLQSTCALIVLDEPHPPWRQLISALFNRNTIHQVAALHIQLQREKQWLEQQGEVYGYRAQATIIKSRWDRSGRSTFIEISFNGTVRARSTW